MLTNTLWSSKQLRNSAVNQLTIISPNGKRLRKNNEIDYDNISELSKAEFDESIENNNLQLVPKKNKIEEISVIEYGH